MKTRPQITIVEPRIRIPAWRSASPKNVEDAAGVDEPHDPAAEAGDLAERGEPVPGYGASQLGASHLITEISGWVASSVWVKT